MLRIEVGPVELSKLLQAVPTVDGQGSAPPRDQAMLPEFHQYTVHVDGRDAEHIGKVDLRDRKSKTVAFSAAYEI